jgi:4-amino-4-deoxy-L-arabinose transferase-like glycosyltransferase
MRRAALVLALAGVGLRVWAWTIPQGALDADEAVVGLLSRSILHGTFPAFFPGQGYGGTQEEWLSAPLLGVFGMQTWAIRLPVLVLWAVAALLVWRIGLRLLDPFRAAVAACLFWVWPAYFVWKSERAHGFYGSELVLGLLVLLVVLRLDERVTRRDLALLGLALGCGLWSSPQVGIVALPALGWLVWRRRDVLRGTAVVAAGAVVGALPWVIANARHGWPSLHPGPNEGPWSEHLHNLVVATLPQALGLRLAWSFEWLGTPVVAIGIYAVVVAGFLWLLWRRPPGIAPLLLVVALFPVFYFVSPYTWLQSEPRYLTLVVPLFALLLAYAASSAARAAAILAVALAFSIGGIVEMQRHHVVAFRTEGTAVPAELGPVLRTLRENDIRYAFASYWVAWRITWESQLHIVGAKSSYARPFARARRVYPGDPPNDLGIDPRYYREAERHRDVAHVFVLGGDVERTVAPLLHRTGYRRVIAGGFAVWLPPGG